MKRWFLKGVLAGSVGTAVVLGAAAAFAATVGDPFKLGQSNTINATSGLYGSTANDQLDVANVGTGASAKGLGVLGRSPSAPAAAIANNNGGPALGLSVNAGKAPFTVNSATKVANLNSDRLDGLDSSDLTQGPGTRVVANRLVLDGDDSGQQLLAIPGLGTLFAYCYSGGGSAAIEWGNSTDDTLDLWRDWMVDPTADFTAQSVPPQTGGYFVATASPGIHQLGGIVALGRGGDIPGPRRSAIVHAFAIKGGNGYPCGFVAEATVWSGP